MALPTLSPVSAPLPLAFGKRLEVEFEKRRAKNSSFSWRSFARWLDVDPSELQKLRSGRRKAGEKVIQRIGGRLGWTPVEIQTVGQFEGRTGPPPEAETQNWTSLSPESLHPLSHWLPFAILSLLAVKGFRPDVGWVARRLGVTKNEVDLALFRLRRVGLLEVTDSGTWVDRSGGRTTTVQSPLPSSQDLRRLQGSYLDKSKEALEEVPMDRRSHSSVTMAVDSSKLDAARELIAVFRRDLSRFMAREGTPDAVYTLNIGLFPLTQDSEDSQ